MPERDVLEYLLERLTSLEQTGSARIVIGITGAPGAGKTTLVEALLRARPDAAWVPMDGFHLADRSLASLGLLPRKGAIETFDAYGYLATLTRLHSDTRNVVYAPDFDRTLEQPIAAGVAVPPTSRVVFTEGNYLLDALPPWPQIQAQLDEIWYCDAPDDLRRERLVQRHMRYGKSRADAIQWVNLVDEPNALRIAARRKLADAFTNLDHAREVPQT